VEVQASTDEVGMVVECCQQLCMADGGTERGVELADIPNESDTLVIVSIESEDPDSGGTPHICA